MEVDVEKDGDTKETIRCETVLCIEGGAAMQIKWMPLGAWDEVRHVIVVEDWLTACSEVGL
jgi:hypothetical protein